MPVSRLALTDFRSYASALIEPGPGFVLLYGENGAGKTNLLEAVSLLTPGRGLRGAALSDMARHGGSGAWGVAAHIAPPRLAGGEAERSSDGVGSTGAHPPTPSRAREGEVQIGTGTQAGAPDRRQVLINGAPAYVNSLSEWLSVLWLTPAMDRLFTGSAGERRRFLDRLVLALEPTHAHHASRYEAAMRARNKLLAEDRWDEDWLDALETQMEEHGVAVRNARLRAVKSLGEAIANGGAVDFPMPKLFIDKLTPGRLKTRLSLSRKLDAAARRSTHGPNNEDLRVVLRAKDLPASQSSTGEQKALLLGLVLAHAELVAERRGEPPILLLDEVAAHLDPGRRSALFARLEGRGQVWMTATEAALFDGIGEASRFHVEPGNIAPA